MAIAALSCPYCGAPVAPSTAELAICSYCSRTLTGVPLASWGAKLDGVEDEDEDPLDGRPYCRVLGRRFVLHGRLARGSRSDVLLAERARKPSELVVIKAWRGLREINPYAGEWDVLSTLAKSAEPGAGFMTTLLPQLVMKGNLTSSHAEERPALVTRWRSGFIHTLRDVRAAYPDGVDARTSVWIWRRLLDLLGWVHRNGVSHGAVLPEHVLVHPRDHGVVLVGWSSAGATHDASRSIRADLEGAARAVLHALGGDAAVPASVPPPLRALLERAANGDTVDSTLVLEAATAAFGPPKYHPFTMPGWS